MTDAEIQIKLLHERTDRLEARLMDLTHMVEANAGKLNRIVHNYEWLQAQDAITNYYSKGKK